MTTDTAQSHHSLAQPGLDRQTPAQWELHAQLAYVFARHARHDLANVHCGVQMLEMVEQIQDGGGVEVPLPPELEPEQMKLRMRGDLKRVVSISNDLVLLSQAASPAPYRHATALPLQTLFEQAILNRLLDDAPPPALTNLPADARVLVMGDMLPAALSAFFFQWTPQLTDLHRARQLRVQVQETCCVVDIPADDQEVVASFARRLQSPSDAGLTALVETNLSITTSELAFWLARHIVRVHGGYVTADPHDPDLNVRVVLPLTRGE